MHLLSALVALGVGLELAHIVLATSDAVEVSLAADALCSSSQINVFTSALKKADSCYSSPSYDWGGNANPTDTQFADVCKCKYLDGLSTPACSVTKSNDTIPLATHYAWVIKDQCPTKIVTPNVTATPNGTGAPNGTAAPNAGPVWGVYPMCSSAATKQFVNNLNTASSGCTSSSSYVWGSNSDPTPAQVLEICKCPISPFEIPKCSWRKPVVYNTSINEYFHFVYTCNDTSGYVAPTVTEVAAAIGPVDPVPSRSGSTDASGNNDLCSVVQMSVFNSALKTASPCLSSISYSWGGSANPTNDQYGQICNCPPVGDFTIPACLVMKGPDRVPLPDHYKWVIRTECPLFLARGSKSNSSKVGLLAGIVVIVLLFGLCLCLCVRKRRTKEETTEYQQERLSDDPVTGVPVTWATYNNANRQTSPGTYRAMPLTPKYKDKTIEMRPCNASTHPSTANSSMRPSSHETTTSTRSTESSKWDDPSVLAVRIPYDAVFMGALISRGGFGEVYRGTYEGETVAIKRMLPELRKDPAQLDHFLSEVQLLSSLQHERIVKFIGVAWNSPSDACMVVEFMQNGDLWSVLKRWDSGPERRMNGFDADKVKIALHVAHALVYLHSLQPVVVHRDLKSKNILLDVNCDAKLTDFGVSRERGDSTMTAGVGSSLWIAPEVMMGSRYDEKADVFSFGVVLSELDTHQLPYFQAQVSDSGQKLPEAAILQHVMQGRLSVVFTRQAQPDLVQLGRECVHLDPKKRPTTAQVLHRVHQVMRLYQ